MPPSLSACVYKFRRQPRSPLYLIHILKQTLTQHTAGSYCTGSCRWSRDSSHRLGNVTSKPCGELSKFSCCYLGYVFGVLPPRSRRAVKLAVALEKANLLRACDPALHKALTSHGCDGRVLPVSCYGQCPALRPHSPYGWRQAARLARTDYMRSRHPSQQRQVPRDLIDLALWRGSNAKNRRRAARYLRAASVVYDPRAQAQTDRLRL